MLRIVLVVVVGDSVPRERVELLVEDVDLPLQVPVLDVVVDREGDALDRVLQVGLGNGAVVQIDGGTRTALLEGAQVGDLVLALPPDHPVLDGGLGTLDEDGLGRGVLRGVGVAVVGFPLTDVLQVADADLAFVQRVLDGDDHAVAGLGAGVRAAAVLVTHGGGFGAPLAALFHRVLGDSRRYLDGECFILSLVVSIEIRIFG